LASGRRRRDLIVPMNDDEIRTTLQCAESVSKQLSLAAIETTHAFPVGLLDLQERADHAVGCRVRRCVVHGDGVADGECVADGEGVVVRVVAPRVLPCTTRTHRSW